MQFSLRIIGGSVVLLLAVSALVTFAWWSAREDPEADYCTGVHNRQQCFAERVDQILADKGFDAAFDALIEFSEQDASFATTCHGNAHQLGKVAYRRFASGDQFHYTHKMSYCGYGFFHGFTEALFAESGNLAEVVAFCESLSAQDGGATGGATACFHGLGHGAVDGSDPRAWGDPALMVRSGLALCAQLPKKRYAQYVCRAGAYNSLEIMSTDPQYGLEALAADPYAFCQAEPREYQDACYVNMIPAVLRTVNNDLREAATYILGHVSFPADVTVDGFRVDEFVIQGLFHEFARLHTEEGDAVKEGVPLCRSFAETRMRHACIRGLSGGLMKYGHPDALAETWLAFCADATLAADEKDSCFSFVLERRHLWYDAQESERVCRSVPDAYQQYCSKTTQ